MPRMEFVTRLNPANSAVETSPMMTTTISSKPRTMLNKFSTLSRTISQYVRPTRALNWLLSPRLMRSATSAEVSPRPLAGIVVSIS